MKKVVQTTLAGMLAVIMLALTACGGGKAPEELAGTWNLTAVRYMGQEMTVEEMEAQDDSISMTFSLEFISDKEVKMVADMSMGTEVVDENETGKYAFEGTTVTLFEKDGKTEVITLELEDGRLSGSMSGITLIFER